MRIVRVDSVRNLGKLYENGNYIDLIATQNKYLFTVRRH